MPSVLTVTYFRLFVIDFERANVCWVHIDKTNTFEDKIEYIMCYVVVFKDKQNLLTNSNLNLYQHNPTVKSVKNSSERVLF